MVEGAVQLRPRLQPHRAEPGKQTTPNPMSLRTRFQLNVTSDNNPGLTRRLRRALPESASDYDLDAFIEMLNRAKAMAALEGERITVKVGPVREERRYRTQGSSAQAPGVDVAIPAAIQQQLTAMNTMIERLLLPTELRTIPNASDALAVLNLDAPTTNLNEPA
jgi:hypothetical protein